MNETSNEAKAEHEFKKVLYALETSNLLDKLRQWNGVFKAKMEEASNPKRRRRTVWRSIDAK